MARTPSYPKDAPVAPPLGAPDTPSPSNPSRRARPGRPPKPAAASDEPPAADSKRTKHLVAGAAIGIGSAALVAALLYANRNKNN